MDHEKVKHGNRLISRIETLEELIRTTESCIQDARDFFSSKEKMLRQPMNSANYLFVAINSLSEERFQRIGKIILQNLDEDIAEAKAEIKQIEEELRTL